MIVKKNLNPIKIWSYIKYQFLYSFLIAFLVWLFYFITGIKEISINFTPIGIIGSSLAIFIAFRNNSSYARWWEARTIWGNIVNSCRILARLIITFTNSHSHQPNFDLNRSLTFQKELVYNVIGWAFSLKLMLRDKNDFSELQRFLSLQEFSEISQAQNKPNKILLLIGSKIYLAMANGTLGGFDSFQMEGQLLSLSNLQGSCERIKYTPIPKQYDYFTKVFVVIFSTLLPFGIIGFFQSETMKNYSWISIILSCIISGIFIVMERTGAANEDPFENLVTDVPMSSICNTIEIDLKEMLSETTLPEKISPKDGYLY
ncbi:MAG: bestrophin family ion channel [Leptospiraceae bacterium]|nr:bestrophin family ion channel [Leptospiraceae bacterium]